MSKQVVAELGQAQVKLEVTVEVGFEVEVTCPGGWVVGKTIIKLNSS